ncbi:MAG: glycoside hydrolase family 31 protein [Cytophagales bacterium]
MSFIDNPSEGKQYPNSISGFKQITPTEIDFFSDKLTLKIYIISSKIVRFRYAIKGYFEKDFSYAINPDFKITKTEYAVLEETDAFVLLLKDFRVFIAKENFKIRIEDNFGKVINEDEKGFHWEENFTFGGQIVYCSKVKQSEECFYGMGDKPTDLNLHEKRVTNWCSDTYGFEKDHDPIYRAIPFYYGLHDHISYGIFIDNTFRTTFDFAKEDTSLISFWADGGEMNYYFIYGPDLDDVTAQYTMLTGTPNMPPKWALGFHQCKWSYYPESKVREIANEFRTREIPCDSIYLDIDYMDGFRCFTWNKEHFPNPKKMMADLKNKGFKTVVIIDPGIKVDTNYSVWKDGWEKDMFCKRSDGPLMTGSVWPGECNFPDFTHPKVREWWADLFKEYYEIGVDGVWNDMNEPAVFGLGTFPDDVRHNYDGQYCSHRKAHNVYGMQMARASNLGFAKFKPQHRPFMITRSSYAGFQRYACVWTGDNISTWQHLWLASVQIQRLSISGVSFCGSDVGGFIGEPEGELFMRWIQLAFLHTFFRAHSSGDKGEKEPWVFGKDNEVIIKKFIELRYQLLPYIYTNFYQYVSAGRPMIKPLVFEDQFDPETQYRQDEFLIGEHFLQCPIVSPNAMGRWLYLPMGLWYNFFNNQIYNGGLEVYCETGQEETPLFVRAGAIIPMYPIQQFVGEKQFDTVTLKIYFGNTKVKSFFYEDEGEGHGYKNNEFYFATFTSFYDEQTSKYIITQTVEGEYTAPYKNYKIELIGFPKSYSYIETDVSESHVFNTTSDILIPFTFNEIKIG